jgi:putative FmdB family regulatory protein
MPTYQYRCQQCSNELEVVQKFTDDALTECPACHGTLRKVYGAVGVVFKGTGFYATDSRAKASAKPAGASDAKTSGGDKPSGGEKTSGEKPTSADKPAKLAKPSAGTPAA